MNPDFFVQGVVAEALQARQKRDYLELKSAIVVAAGVGKKEVTVSSKYFYPQSLIQELDASGIVCMGENQDEDDGSIATTFDIEKMGASV